MTVESNDSDVPHVFEVGMGLVLRIDIVLNFRHGELADAEQTSTRRDFISERTTNLCRGEWQAPVVVVK